MIFSIVKIVEMAQRYVKNINKLRQAVNETIDEYENILCIGSAFMTRRAKMCASACGYPTDKIDFYGTVDTSGRNIGPNSWWLSDTATKRVLEELKRIAEYTLKGDLSLE